MKFIFKARFKGQSKIYVSTALLRMLITTLFISLALSGCNSSDLEINQNVTAIDNNVDGTITNNGVFDNNNVTTSGGMEVLTSKTDPVVKSKDIPPIVAPKISIKLERFTLPGILTINKPKGWQFYKTGEYNTIAFLTRDEEEPLRQVFFFGEIGVFYTNKEQRELEIYYHNNGGYSIPWIDMPLVSPFDGKAFFENFNAIMNTQIADEFLSSGRMPVPCGFDNILVISQEETTPMMPNMPTYFVRAVLSKDGKAAQGNFVVSSYSDAFGHGTGFIVAGITAPMREFSSLQTTLIEVINSFTMDSAYVGAGISVINDNNESFKAISKSISETSDIIIKGYEGRNRTKDVIMEKSGDQFMGVERVYDPDTDEVYEVKNGFFDHYNTHKQEYKKGNLQQLPDNDYNLWDKAPIINHNLTSP